LQNENRKENRLRLEKELIHRQGGLYEGTSQGLVKVGHKTGLVKSGETLWGGQGKCGEVKRGRVDPTARKKKNQKVGRNKKEVIKKVSNKSYSEKQDQKGTGKVFGVEGGEEEGTPPYTGRRVEDRRKKIRWGGTGVPACRRLKKTLKELSSNWDEKGPAISKNLKKEGECSPGESGGGGAHGCFSGNMGGGKGQCRRRIRKGIRTGTKDLKSMRNGSQNPMGGIRGLSLKKARESYRT